MSLKVMERVWLHVSDLKPPEKLVLLFFADKAHEDDGSRSFPAVKTVATACSMFERSVRTIIKRLRTRGYLVVEQPARQRYAVTYRVVAPLLKPQTCSLAAPLDAPDLQADCSPNAPDLQARCTPNENDAQTCSGDPPDLQRRSPRPAVAIPQTCSGAAADPINLREPKRTAAPAALLVPQNALRNGRTADQTKGAEVKENEWNRDRDCPHEPKCSGDRFECNRKSLADVRERVAFLTQQHVFDLLPDKSPGGAEPGDGQTSHPDEVVAPKQC